MTPANILLVEDNEGDIFLMEDALEEAGLSRNFCAVRDGEEALDYLLQKGPYKNAIVPDLILLDLNLPKINGCELLTRIKTYSHLQGIPVVILSTSSSLEDKKSSYKACADGFITKPVDADSFPSVIRQIKSYWASVSEKKLYN